jgi:hypothetical protein
MISTTIELARLFIDSYQNKADIEAGVDRLRESIHRELRLNAELAAEAEKARGNDFDLANSLLASMQTHSFDALSVAGLPLAKNFPSSWSASDDPPPAYANHFENIHQVSELVERAYHRIRIQRIRIDVGQAKDPKSSQYLRILLGNAAQATRPAK